MVHTFMFLTIPKLLLYSKKKYSFRVKMVFFQKGPPLILGFVKVKKQNTFLELYS